MQCVILAGGLGTRMWPDAKTTPKTLLPVAGRPFAWWQLNWLAESGVDSVVYCIGHLGEQIRDFVGDGSGWGLHVAYADEGDQLRGTAGAIALASDDDVLDERFLVLYGDSWLQIDPADVLRDAEESDLPALMTVFDNHGEWDGSNVVYAGGRVRRYEKGLDPAPPEMHWIDYGLSVFTRDLIDTRVPRDRPSDLAPLCTSLAAAGDLAGYVATERFYEIGSPQGLRDTEVLLLGTSAQPG
ncbi:MAG: Nucleotidyl transferase [Pseudonocardiales bacterium]|nr:Nucleotidyl transferase [Pseudonocardiales bacterium]